jgi:hypothetical protein
MRDRTLQTVIQCVFLAVFMLPVTGIAQDSALGNWFIYLGNKKIDSRWNWHNEVQYRNYNFIGDLEQLLLRTGVGYNLSEDNNNVLLGYGYILSQNYVSGGDEKIDIHEHRLFQQFITFQRFAGVSLQHRYRFEQRFVEDDFLLRFRYFLSVNVPLKKRGAEGYSWYLSAYNEIFLNSEGSIFDRNRLYGGIGYRLSSTVRFEAGYMNQFLPEDSRDQINLVAFVAL